MKTGRLELENMCIKIQACNSLLDRELNLNFPAYTKNWHNSSQNELW